MAKTVTKTWYYIDGKDVLLPEICTDPTGKKMWKHNPHNDGFRTYCLECGEIL